MTTNTTTTNTTTTNQSQLIQLVTIWMIRDLF